MARAIDANELGILQRPDYKVHARLTIQNTPLKDILGKDPLLSFSIVSDVNDLVESATFTCELLRGPQSLSPYLSGGAKFDGVPILASGFLLDCEIQCLPPGQEPAFFGWRKIFSGDVDTADVVPGDGVIKIPCRDRHVGLLKTQIENITLVDGQQQWGFPVAAGLLQDQGVYIINTAFNYGYGFDAPDTFNVLDNPTTSASAFWQERTSILEALRSLMVGLNGFDLRGRWDVTGNDSYGLTYYLPGSGPVFNFTRLRDSSIPYALRHALFDRRGIRNVAEVTPADAARVPVITTDPESIDRNGRAFIAAAEDAASHIDTPEEAGSLGATMVGALSKPPSAVEIETPFIWHVELNDRFTLEPDGYCFDDSGTYGIHHLEKTWDRGNGSTVIAGRAVPGSAALSEFRALDVRVHPKEVYVRVGPPVGPGRKGAFWVEVPVAPEVPAP